MVESVEWVVETLRMLIRAKGLIYAGMHNAHMIDYYLHCGMSRQEKAQQIRNTRNAWDIITNSR